MRWLLVLVIACRAEVRTPAAAMPTKGLAIAIYSNGIRSYGVVDDRRTIEVVGDTVFLDRIENALGEAVLSRDKVRREESWGKLEKAFNNNEKVHGVIFNQVKGGFTVDLDGAVAFLPRSQVDIRPIGDVAPLTEQGRARLRHVRS